MAQFRKEALSVIRQRVGYLIHRDKFMFGTVAASPSPTSTTFALLKAARFSDGYFNGSTIYAVSGPGAGENHSVSGFARGTGIFTSAEAWAVTPTSSTQVEIWPEHFNVDQVNVAINQALLGVQDITNVRYNVDVSASLDATRRVVTLPADMVKIARVEWTIGTGVGSLARVARAASDRAELNVSWLNYTTEGIPYYSPTYLLFALENGLVYLSYPIEAAATNILAKGYRLRTS